MDKVTDRPVFLGLVLVLIYNIIPGRYFPNMKFSRVSATNFATNKHTDNSI